MYSIAILNALLDTHIYVYLTVELSRFIIYMACRGGRLGGGLAAVALSKDEEVNAFWYLENIIGFISLRSSHVSASSMKIASSSASGWLVFVATTALPVHALHATKYTSLCGWVMLSVTRRLKPFKVIWCLTDGFSGRSEGRFWRILETRSPSPSTRIWGALPQFGANRLGKERKRDPWREKVKKRKF